MIMHYTCTCTLYLLYSEPLVIGSPLKAELVPAAVPHAPSRPVGRGSRMRGGSGSHCITTKVKVIIIF